MTQGKNLFVSVPNRDGECWVYMARISQLVPINQEANFIANGFCLSPVSVNPDEVWQKTSALVPEKP